LVVYAIIHLSSIVNLRRWTPHASNDKSQLAVESTAEARTMETPRQWTSVIVEATELVQCADNFITEQQCADCGCCWNARRLPACYQSYGQHGQRSKV